MKKKQLGFLLLIFLAFFTSCSNDGNFEFDAKANKTKSDMLSLSEARVELEKLLDDVYGQTSTRTFNPKKKVIVKAFTINNQKHSTRTETTKESIIHVFNFANKGGFALMSGNREMPSLLALADSGEISDDTPIDNPGFILFLQGASNQYDHELTDDEEHVPDIIKEYGEWENIVYKPGGYCDVMWGQLDPYNMYCPTIGNEKTVTGCVATAVAQLMSVYKYPSTYGNYSFNWDEMTQDSMPQSDLAKTQVARLMKEIGNGDNLKMKYGLIRNGGSSAKIKDIPKTLSNFKYSNGGRIVDYNTDNVVSELVNGYPVLLSGFSNKKVKRFLGIKVGTTYTEGHCWLGHGVLERRRSVTRYSKGKVLGTYIQNQWYILCNWGWKGGHNGYYLSNAFNADNKPSFPVGTRSEDDTNGTSKHNYQFKVQTILDIRK